VTGAINFEKGFEEVDVHLVPAISFIESIISFRFIAGKPDPIKMPT
jgi:hypothetical protein